MKKSTTSSCSYEQYMKDQLEMLSKNFVIKTYKRAGSEKWDRFENGIDLRIRVQWEGKSIYEFLVEKSFWYQRNTNKEDKVYMRRWADPKVEMIGNGIVRKPMNVPSPKPQRIVSKRNNSISQTQDKFEQMKKS